MIEMWPLEQLWGLLAHRHSRHCRSARPVQKFAPEPYILPLEEPPWLSLNQRPAEFSFFTQSVPLYLSGQTCGLRPRGSLPARAVLESELSLRLRELEFNFEAAARFRTTSPSPKPN